MVSNSHRERERSIHYSLSRMLRPLLLDRAQYNLETDGGDKYKHAMACVIVARSLAIYASFYYIRLYFDFSFGIVSSSKYTLESA